MFAIQTMRCLFLQARTGDIPRAICVCIQKLEINEIGPYSFVRNARTCGKQSVINLDTQYAGGNR